MDEKEKKINQKNKDGVEQKMEEGEEERRGERGGGIEKKVEDI